LEPFKNWLNENVARKMARAIARTHPRFDQKIFLSGISPALAPLELKERMLLLKARLKAGLPEDTRRAFPILLGALKQNEKDTDGLSGFEVWPLTHWVAEEGLDHFDESMRALHAMTQVFTAEFAIRPFLIHAEKETLKQLHHWTNDPSDHVRRLVSEGSRPLLPWGVRLPAFVADPEKTWTLLEKLKNDSAVYVRKSVANHINDHSKHHADWVVARLQDWKKRHADAAGVQWIIRHGTRTLIKQGHVDGLALHGISAAAVELLKWSIDTPRIRLGEALRLTVTLRNAAQRPAEVWIDIDLQLAGSRGQARSKIFKGKELTLAPGRSETVTLSVPIRRVTTRAYYPGKQSVSLLLNGRRSDPLSFDLRLK